MFLNDSLDESYLEPPATSLSEFEQCTLSNVEKVIQSAASTYDP